MKKILLALAIALIIYLGLQLSRGPKVETTSLESGVSTSVEKPQGTETKSAATQGVSVSQPSSKPEEIPMGAELRGVIEQVRKDLPSLEVVKNHTEEEMHQPLPELVHAGQSLGDLAEYLERRPEEFRSASVFYADCAANAGYFPSIRAVCYQALQGKESEWAPGVREKISQVTPDIVNIAKDL